MAYNLDAQVPMPRVLVAHDNCHLRACLVAEDLHVDPVQLASLKRFMVVEQGLLSFECFEHNTDKQVREQKVDHDVYCNAKNDESRLSQALGLIINFLDVEYGCLDLVQSHHALPNVVELEA